MVGILPIIKPQGITSHTATSKLKHLTGEKAGHFGTLDPMATGVLPILIGKATRLSDFLESDKCYVATIKLGIETDTGDITGNIINTCSKTNVKPDDFTLVLNSFKGNISQIPPMYSAIKQNGRKLYELARQGIEIDRKPRQITIFDIKLLEANSEIGEYEIFVHCSSGTYIRSLAIDIGEALGTKATMSTLSRTKACGIDIKDAYTLEDILNNYNKSNIEKLIISPEQIFKEVPKIIIPDDGLKYYLNGGSLATNRIEGFMNEKIFRAYSKENVFLGLSALVNDEIKASWLC